MVRWRGRVARRLLELKKVGCRLFLPLIDPDKPVDTTRLTSVFKYADAVLIGGSLGVTPYDVDKTIDAIRAAGYDGPIILFPGGLNNLSAKADAVLFMSLLNSDDPYWIIGAQVTAAPLVAKLGLEPLPAAYIIVGEGGSAGHVGRARPIPPNKPELVAAYALAAKFLGMKFVYLEAGSGAERAIPPEVVNATRRAVGDDIFLIVGGGVRDPQTATTLLRSGADAIVVGTLLEENPTAAAEIGATVKSLFRCNAPPGILT